MSSCFMNWPTVRPSRCWIQDHIRGTHCALDPCKKLALKGLWREPECRARSIAAVQSPAVTANIAGLAGKRAVEGCNSMIGCAAAVHLDHLAVDVGACLRDEQA